jgi:CubicO group peptidase (beta-lactamase class C family)
MNALTKHRSDFKKRIFRTVDIPSDLASVTDIDEVNEVNPAEAEILDASVEAIWEAVEDLYRSGVYPMLSLCLRRHGKIVLNRSLGEYAEGKKADINTPVCLFSASKAISAVLIHLLDEQGHVNLLNPVSYYIPAFSAKGKGSITLQQLLSHRGGVPKVPEDVDLDLLFDHDAALQMVCDSLPTDHRGGTQAYHAITSGFLFAELIKVTTGMTAQQYLKKYISDPMEMRYFRYGLNKRDQAHVAHNSVTGLNSSKLNDAMASVLGTHPESAVDMTNDPRFFSAILPSANIFATAEEVSRFYQMLLDHGSWQGKQILDPLTVHRAIQPLGKVELDRSLMMPIRYSAGMMLGGSPMGIYGKETEYAYGHLGYANIFGWADPQRDIAVSLMNSGKPIIGPHIKALMVLLGTISNECELVHDMRSDIPAYKRQLKRH